MKENNAARLERLKDEGWIGVDFDGTLAHYDKWVVWNVFGKPILPMVHRVVRWIDEGRTVKIMTARVRPPGDLLFSECIITGEKFTNRQMIDAIQDWTFAHIGHRLEVTCVKDVHMIELWDDRAVQVVPNTGRTLAEEHLAEMTALRGKSFQGGNV
jgi:hypothetical protein